jgi:hypothetical protein
MGRIQGDLLMETSREQFEERFPVPAGVRWDRRNQVYVCEFVSPYLALWMGWQASREDIEVRLPKEMKGPEGDGLDGDYEEFEMHEAVAYEVNSMRLKCAKAIQAYGLKVKA